MSARSVRESGVAKQNEVAVVLPMIGEPPRTPYDLHFRCAGIPVRVSPMFWLATIFLGANGSGAVMVMFVVAAFISILVHELGHALVMKRFKETPRIVLLLSGGLAISERPSYLPESQNRSTKEQVLISLAGPAAGFVLAGIIVVLAGVAGANFHLSLPLTVQADFIHLADEASGNERTLTLISQAVTILLWINIYWGAMNLLPVYPLDGGQVARELMTMRDPWKGVVRSLWLAIIVGVLIVAVALSFQSYFVAVLFGFFTFTNYRTLQGFSASGGYGGSRGGGGGGGYDDGYGGRDERPW